MEGESSTNNHCEIDQSIFFCLFSQIVMAFLFYSENFLNVIFTLVFQQLQLKILAKVFFA